MAETKFGNNRVYVPDRTASLTPSLWRSVDEWASLKQNGDSGSEVWGWSLDLSILPLINRNFDLMLREDSQSLYRGRIYNLMAMNGEMPK